MTDHASQRSTRADITFVALLDVAGVVFLYLGRSLTFWHDEWRSITFSGGAIDYPEAGERALVDVSAPALQSHFQGRSSFDTYLPYLAEVIVLHLLAVAGAYVLMRRRVDPLVAMALAIPLLFLGAGSENLFWAFQTGLVGSVMFGVWALAFIERPGRWSSVIASVLLLASLMSSGLGPVFLVACLGADGLRPISTHTNPRDDSTWGGVPPMVLAGRARSRRTRPTEPDRRATRRSLVRRSWRQPLGRLILGRWTSSRRPRFRVCPGHGLPDRDLLGGGDPQTARPRS